MYISQTYKYDSIIITYNLISFLPQNILSKK